MTHTHNSAAESNKRTTLFVIAFFLFITTNVFSQMDSSYVISWVDGNQTRLSEIGPVTIIPQTGKSIRNCTIWEIKGGNVVYIKNGSLHDISIYKIERIDKGPGSKQAIFFDENEKPVIRYTGISGSASINITSKKAEEKKDSGAHVVRSEKIATPAHNPQNYSYEQDTIVTISGSAIVCRILKETDSSIFYLHQGKGRTIEKSSIASMAWRPSALNKNDSVAILQAFNTEEKKATEDYFDKTRRIADPQAAYNTGWKDSKKHFKGGGAFAGGLASGIFFPYGWASATIIAAIPPTNINNPSNPNNKMLYSDEAYAKGYKKGAHGKKAGKVLGGFAIGIGIDLLVLMAVSSFY